MAKKLAVGDLAPAFAMRDEEGQVVSLASLRGRRFVLFFYPNEMHYAHDIGEEGHSCAICEGGFLDLLEDLRSCGYLVYGANAGGVIMHKRLVKKHALDFSLLSDPDDKTATKYGVSNRKMLYGDECVIVYRSTFMIDEDGVITDTRYNIKKEDR